MSEGKTIDEGFWAQTDNLKQNEQHRATCCSNSTGKLLIRLLILFFYRTANQWT